MKNVRKNLLLGFGRGGGGVDPVDDGGAVCTLPLGGGVRGTFCGGILDRELGVAGVGCPPTGAADEVALFDPGRTEGFESEMLGLLTSAYPL